MIQQKSPPPQQFLVGGLLGNYTRGSKKVKKQKLNFLLKVFFPSGEVQRYETASYRPFLNQIRTINWQGSPLKVYLRVSYGKRECVHGCPCSFYNDGFYENSSDLLSAFYCFVEDYHGSKNYGVS